MNSLHRTRRNACAAIDAHVGVNIAAFAVGVETLYRAILHAIGEETKSAIVRYDMWHVLGPLTDSYKWNVDPVPPVDVLGASCQILSTSTRLSE